MLMDGTLGLFVRDVYNQKLYAQHVFLRPLDVQVYDKKSSSTKNGDEWGCLVVLGLLAIK